MKKITVEVFSYSELSEDAKKRALEDYRNSDEIGYSIQSEYDDAHSSVQKFCQIFNTREGRENWLQPSFYNINLDIRNLKGIRLLKYLYNNYYDDLFKKKLIKVIDDKHIDHRMVENRTTKDGRKISYVYSNLQKETDCVLTGYMWDEYLLIPFYDFLSKPENDKTIEDLIKESYSNLEKALKSSEEEYYSEEDISGRFYDEEVVF